MHRRAASPAVWCGVALVMMVFILPGAPAPMAGARDDDDDHLRIITLSTRPDTVSGGSVLVRIRAHREVPLSTIIVTLNGHDVTGAFKPETDRSLLGLVEGLRLGDNVLAAASSTRGKHHRGSELTLTNHPITGPIFSGPHEQPFFCMTQNFRVPSAATSTQTTANTFKLLPNPQVHPPDLAPPTTTTEGKTVPYIVRVETGTINRAIYQTAVLHDPTTESVPTPFAPPAAWNRRLVYTLGGGCVGGWYIQGTSIGNGGILEHLHLSQGYGVASSTLNVFGNNCQEVLAAESLMMVKERFIKNYGAVFFTIGWGCSGGSEQSLPISDDYPGLLDGIVPGCSFPEVTAAQVMNITDADLLDHYFKRTALPWSDAEKVGVSGYANAATIATIGPPNAIRVKAQGGACNAAIPLSMRYDKTTNPTGVRCDVYDHMVNIFGRDPATGFARRPLDNTGVQYGLAALNAGAITKQQFLDLNQLIGGYDNDGNYVATRTVGDLEALRIAYRTGRVTYGGAGMRKTPIIDYRGYVDQQPAGNVHQRFHSYELEAGPVARPGPREDPSREAERPRRCLLHSARYREDCRAGHLPGGRRLQRTLRGVFVSAHGGRRTRGQQRPQVPAEADRSGGLHGDVLIGREGSAGGGVRSGRVRLPQAWCRTEAVRGHVGVLLSAGGASRSFQGAHVPEGGGASN